MNIIISDKKKKDLFISLFHLLKCSSPQMNASFLKDKLHIQGMDQAHVCLFDLNLTKEWFNKYDIENEENVCFNSNIFYSMISVKSDSQQSTLKKTGDETLQIELTGENSKNDYNKFFTMPIMEYDYEEMNIPEVEADAEMSIPSKKAADIIAQLSNFGDDLHIKCSDNDVDFKTKGDSGEMRVNISIDDMSSYSVVEGENMELTYSLVYVSKMCITNKLSTDVDFSLSNDRPMKIKYELGDNSSLFFYIAPKN